MSNRRDFLFSTASIGIVSVGVNLSVQHFVMGSPVAEDIEIALLSDTHIHTDPSNGHRGFKPHENLKRVVEEVIASQSKTALLCGDAARGDGQISDYEQLKKLIEPVMAKMPVHIALGNHDDRANFLKVFEPQVAEKSLAGKKHVSVVDIGPQRWIVLDSLMYVDKVPGFLGEEQRNWLDKTLQTEPSKPTVLMVHHTLGTRDGELLDADRLLTIAEKHRQVRAILFGHSHHWGIERRGRLSLINLPAIGYNFADNEPIGWTLARISPTRLELQLRPIGGNVEPALTNAIVDFTA